MAVDWSYVATGTITALVSALCQFVIVVLVWGKLVKPTWERHHKEKLTVMRAAMLSTGRVVDP